MSGDRSFSAFLVAIRTFPGFGTRVAVTACFMVVLARQTGIESALLIVGATVVVALAIGYPMWRRFGTRTVR